MPPPKLASGQTLVKNSALNLIGLIIPSCVGLVAVPFAIKGLGTEAFGVLSIGWIFLGYLGLFDFGISRGITKYVAEVWASGDLRELGTIVWSGLVVSLLLGLVAGGAFALFVPVLTGKLLKIPAELIGQTSISFYFLAMGLPFVLLATSFMGILSAVQRFDHVNFVSIPQNIISFIIPALALPLGLNLATVMLLIVCVRIVSAFAYLFFCVKLFPEVFTHMSFHVRTLKKLLSYGGWVTITGIVSPILTYIDRFFIGSFLSMQAVAYYTTPQDAISRIRVFPIAIMNAVFPEFSAMSGNIETRRMEELIIRSAKYILLITGCTGLMLALFANDILNIWLGQEFAAQGTMVFRIFCLGIIINSLAYVPFNLLQGIGKPSLPAIFHLAELLVYIVLIVFLIKQMGVVGAAIAWFSRILIDFILLSWFTWRRYPGLIRQFSSLNLWKSTIAIILFAFSLVLVHVFFQSATDRIVMSLMGLCLLIGFTWNYIIDEYEKKLVKRIIVRRQR